MKLKPENKVLLKRELVNRKISQSILSRQFEVSKQTINDVIWGRSNNKKLIQQIKDAVGFDFTMYHN